MFCVLVICYPSTKKTTPAPKHLMCPPVMFLFCSSGNTTINWILSNQLSVTVLRYQYIDGPSVHLGPSCSKGAFAKTIVDQSVLEASPEPHSWAIRLGSGREVPALGIVLPSPVWRYAAANKARMTSSPSSIECSSQCSFQWWRSIAMPRGLCPRVPTYYQSCSSFYTISLPRTFCTITLPFWQS